MLETFTSNEEEEKEYLLHMWKVYPLLIPFKKDRTYKQLYFDMIEAIGSIQKDYGIPYMPISYYNPIEMYEYYKRVKDQKKIYNDGLRLSAVANRIDVAELMIEKGADDFVTALQTACDVGNLDIIKFFIEKKGVETAPYNSYPLRSAAYEGHLDVIKYLVEKGANIDQSGALVIASYHGRLDIVRYLVENGADIHIQNDSTIRIAKEYERWEIVEYLESL